MDKKNTIDDEMSQLSPEEIKAIGEIEIGPSKQEEFLNKHYKKLIAGGIVLMVAISAGICIASFRQQHQAAGSHTLFSAAKVVSPGDVAVPTEYDAKALDAVLDEYSDTGAAPTAKLMAALSRLEDDKTAAGALSTLEELAGTAKSELLRARALAAIASHYSENGQTEKAIETWKRLTQLPANSYTALAYISLGDFARNAGDIETARSYYNLLAKECPASPLTRNRIAEVRLMLLDADDPEPVKPLPVTQPQQPAAPALPGQSGGLDLSIPTLPGQPLTPGL